MTRFPPTTPRAPRQIASILTASLLLASQTFAAKEDYSENAQIRFQQKDYKGALIELKNALKANPKDLPARILMAKTFLEMKNWALAEKEAKDALALGADTNLAQPLLAKAYLYQEKYNEAIQESRGDKLNDAARAELLVVRGRAYLALHQLDEAEKALNEAGKLAPGRAEPLLELARVMIARGKSELAEDLADRALADDSANADGWFLKGELRRQKSDFGAAMKNYDKSIALTEDSAEALVGRAMAWYGLKRDKEALEDVNAAIKQIPYHTGAIYLKMVIASRLGDSEASRQAMEEAKTALNRLKPEFISSHAPSLLLSGMLRYNENHMANAQAAFSEYLLMEPNSIPVRKILGTMLLQQGRLEDAIDKLKPAVALAADDDQVYLLLGNAYRLSGKLPEAAEVLEKGGKILPKSASLKILLAQTRLDLGETKEAQSRIETALNLEPDNVSAGLLMTEIQLKQGDYEAALKRAQAIAQKEPKEPLAHNYAGIAYVNLGNPKAARASFERALALNADFTPTLRNLARLDMQEGNTTAAATSLKKILEKAPDDFQSLQQLSLIAEKENRLDEAVSWLEKIPTRNSEGITAQTHLVELYLRMNRKDMAASTAERLHELDPNNFAALYELAHAKLAQGKREEAANVFYGRTVRFANSAEKSHAIAKVLLAAQDIAGARHALLQAVNTNPDFLPAQLELITLELDRGQFEEALRLANQLRERFPKVPAGDLLAGDALLRLNRPGEAAQAYRKGMAKEDSAAFAVRLYQAVKAAESPDKALAGLEQWSKDHPKDRTGRHMLAIGYLDAGRYETAIAAHEQVLRDEPDSAEIINNLAWLYQREGDARALEYAEKAHRLDPANPAILDTLGWIHAQKGDGAHALAYLRDAQTRASGDPGIRYHLAVALHQLGRDDEARQQLSEALKSNLDFDGRKEAQALVNELSK